MTPDRIGTPLWRCGRCFELTGSSIWFMSPDETCAYPHDPYTAHSEPHVALSLDPQKRVEYRDALAERMIELGMCQSPAMAEAEGEALLAVLLGVEP